MCRRGLWIVCLAAAAAASLAPASARAQDSGVAVITSPLAGAMVSGEVLIVGTATHSSFQRYELAFAYSANPTDTWFVIVTGEAPVANDVLARWNTAAISDGSYVLRLRVFGEGGFLEAQTPEVRVANATPTAPASLPQPTATAQATATEAIIVLPPTETPRPSATPAPLAGPGGQPPADVPAEEAPVSAGLVARAFAAGVRVTLIAFLIMAGYASLRAMLRLGLRR